MKTFLFTQSPSDKRNMNVMVKAYRLKRNKPVYLGHQHLNTAATKGAFAIACEIITEAKEAKMANDGYGLQGKDHVIQI